jgi:hypothetical protein
MGDPAKAAVGGNGGYLDGTADGGGTASIPDQLDCGVGQKMNKIDSVT